jgi:hypothetical protein
MSCSVTTTFREIFEAARQEAAISAWERARHASSLRHLATARGDRRGARRLSEIKKDAIRRVAFVLPEQLIVTLDADEQIGLLSVLLKGHGRLHLPADTDLPATHARRPYLLVDSQN